MMNRLSQSDRQILATFIATGLGAVIAQHFLTPKIKRRFAV